MGARLRASLFVAAIAPLPLAESFADATCTLPGRLPQPKLQGIDWKNAAAPTDYYALALSWSPQFCADRSHRRNNEFQCQANDFDFVVHGLWPQTSGVRNKFGHPRHCRPADKLEPKLLQAHLCTVPGVDLMQNEWAKHGTCAFTDPDAYFGKIEALWSVLRKPDLESVFRRKRSGITAADVRDAFLKANADKGLAADNVSVRVGSGNYLSEVLVCYDKNFAYRSCEPGGTPPGQKIRIRY
jgi:ribonuclease T2